MFSTSWIVDCRISFTVEEDAAISFGHIGGTEMFTRWKDGAWVPVTLGELRTAGGYRADYGRPLDAQGAADNWENEHLPRIKGLIDAVSRFKTGTRTIEL